MEINNKESKNPANFSVASTDGTIQNGYVWQTDKAHIGNVVLVHGMCEYSLRYDEFAKYLNSKGYNVYSLDHIGHGINAKEGLGVWKKDTFDKCVENIRLEIESISDKEKPVVLIGHSMGSYMCQYYLEKYGNDPKVYKMVLIGTSGPRGVFKLGKLVANIHGLFHKYNKPSRFLKKMAFSGFNSKIKKSERYSKSDWISTNLEIRKKYAKDPFCTFVPSVGFYKSFFSHLVKLHSRKYRKLSSRNVPIFIIGGKEDPVTQYGKGIHVLHAEYARIGINSNIKIYENMRHELLNENNKEIVYEDIYKFLN